MDNITRYLVIPKTEFVPYSNLQTTIYMVIDIIDCEHVDDFETEEDAIFWINS